MSYSLSYSTVEDIYALAADDKGEDRVLLLKLAEDLEQMGVGHYDGEEFVLYDTPYGREVLSMEDWLTETGQGVEDDE